MDINDDLKIKEYIENQFICKFGLKEHLEQIVEGKFYFNPLSKYARDDKSGDMVYDVNEGSMIIESPAIIKVEIDGHWRELGKTDKTTFRLKNNNEIGNISFSKPKLNIVNVKGNKYELEFDEKYLNNMKETCVDYTHVYLGRRDNIETSLYAMKRDFYFDDVIYYDPKSLDTDIFMKVMPHYLKTKDYEYQREIRACLHSNKMGLMESPIKPGGAVVHVNQNIMFGCVFNEGLNDNASSHSS